MEKWIARLLGLVVPVASPEIRNTLNELLDRLEQQAKETPNPWDDVLADMLNSVLRPER